MTSNSPPDTVTGRALKRPRVGAATRTRVRVAISSKQEAANIGSARTSSRVSISSWIDCRILRRHMRHSRRSSFGLHQGLASDQWRSTTTGGAAETARPKIFNGFQQHQRPCNNSCFVQCCRQCHSAVKLGQSECEHGGSGACATTTQPHRHDFAGNKEEVPSGSLYGSDGAVADNWHPSESKLCNIGILQSQNYLRKSDLGMSPKFEIFFFAIEGGAGSKAVLITEDNE